MTVLRVFCVSMLAAILFRSSGDPTFLIFKYQHAVGDEIDRCVQDGSNTACDAHVELRFTGSSIALDARIQTDGAFAPLAYRAKGQNSTRSFIDVDVAVAPAQARPVFTLQQDVPFLAQELLLKYWRRHGRPERVALLPAGEVRIRLRGTTDVAVPSSEILSRYTVHGVTWGNETLWTNAREELVALVGADAEEDRLEVVRPEYRPALTDFARQAAADAVADLEQATKATPPVASGTFAITHATVFEPETGAPPARDVTILVHDGRIAAVGSNLAIPRNVRAINVAGKFVLPGLWDTHAHFEQWEWGPACLAAGVTTVRDVGNEVEFLVPIRRFLTSGQGLGPRLIAAGLIDSDPGSLTSEHAEDEATARAIVRRYHDLGFEQMKIYQSLRPALISVVADEAHRLGMTVTGHVPTGSDALTAVRDGMDQINHIGYVTRVMRPQGAATINADSPEARTAIRVLLSHQTVVEPTLARSEFNGHPRRQSFSAIEPSVALLPPELAIILNNAGVTEDREARATAGLQAALDTAGLLHQAGVPILAGTDQVVPGFSIGRELELLVRAGLSPVEAIRSATSVPGKVFGVASSGVVRVGGRADLIVIDGNPIANISDIRRVSLTIAAGRAYDPADLRRAASFR